MSIYIQVENITTDEIKRFGPYESVTPELQVDEGNGWTEGPVSAIRDNVNVTDDLGEPYSYAEVQGEDGYGPYWHNCYIVQSESVFDKNDPYTNNPTMLRIYREHDGDWTLDGINAQGQFTETTWAYGTLEDLKLHIFEFIEQHAPALKDSERQTHRVSVLWEVEATDEDDACEQVISDLDEKGIAVYSIRAERAERDGAAP